MTALIAAETARSPPQSTAAPDRARSVQSATGTAPSPSSTGYRLAR